MAHPEYLSRCGQWGRAVGALAGVLLSLLGGPAALAADDLVEQGRRIYVDGVLPSGAPLTALRAGDVRGEGSSVACVTCHRPSGMGQVEGDLQVRPITGNYLYHIGRKNMATMDPRIGKRMNQAHVGYNDETLARAIREGINSQNARMVTLMPRYNLEAPDMAALQAYLKQLSANWSPGVTAKMIHFATIVTPDVDPARRKIYVDMLQGIFDQKNGSTMPGRRHMVSPAEMLGGTERNWSLHVWTLEGAPETWAAQLEAFYARQPVFSVLGGLSSGDWSPVADFCEQKQLPNWFPSVDYSPLEHGRYTVYFSRGVGLEADVLAKTLHDGAPIKGSRGTRRTAFAPSKSFWSLWALQK
jgi:mono/diheme cytochrome c family protein